MAAGDFYAWNHGVHSVSGADAWATSTLSGAIAAVSITPQSIASGAFLSLLPADNGQVAVIEVNIEI